MRFVPPTLKIVFVVLAHSEPKLLGRFLGRLDAPWAHCVVHIDGKVDQAPFETALADLRNVAFLPESWRVKVHWGTFSCARAVFNLIKFALDQHPDAHRLVFLSGVGYPLAPLSRIAEVLAGDQEFIRIDRQIVPGGPASHDQFVSHRYFRESTLFNERTGPAWLRDQMGKLEHVLPAPDMGPTPIFHGSTSMSLTAEACRQILGYYNVYPERLERFRHAWIPEEMALHSALKDVPAGARISQDYSLTGAPPAGPLAHLHGVHFINWDAGKSGPSTLTEADLPDLDASGALFGRKFSLSESATLMDLLDRRDR